MWPILLLWNCVITYYCCFLFLNIFVAHSWFLGRRPEFVDPKVVSQGEGREGKLIGILSAFHIYIIKISFRKWRSFCSSLVSFGCYDLFCRVRLTHCHFFAWPRRPSACVDLPSPTGQCLALCRTLFYGDLLETRVDEGLDFAELVMMTCLVSDLYWKSLFYVGRDRGCPP